MVIGDRVVMKSEYCIYWGDKLIHTVTNIYGKYIELNGVIWEDKLIYEIKEN